MVKTNTRKSKEPPMAGTDRIMQKLRLSKGMSINRAIVQSSEYIDSQSDPLKASNAIIQTLEVPLMYVTEPTQAKVLALASIEQLLVMDQFDPNKAAEIATFKFERLRKKMPYAVKGVTISKSRKGAKRDVARQIYLENKGVDEKEIIALVAKELEVSLQNAYTYIYLIKKDLKT